MTVREELDQYRALKAHPELWEHRHEEEPFLMVIPGGWGTTDTLEELAEQLIEQLGRGSGG